ncbi:MAG: hypothetical protein ABH884_03365 [Candidatus Komeilibacteria bacterium]
MNNFEITTSTIIQEVEQNILDSRQKIEDEFTSTDNTWMACFITRLTILYMRLLSSDAKSELGTEKYDVVSQKLEALNEKAVSLSNRYPDKLTSPPEDIKNELLKSLNVLE